MSWIVPLVAMLECKRVSFERVDDGGTAIDAAPDGPPPPCVVDGFACPSGGTVVTCGTTCFAVCLDDIDSWSDGVARCTAWGGSLAHVEEVEMQTCLAGYTNDTWFGYVQGAPATSPEDDWHWLDGRVRTFVNWNPTEPQDRDGIEDGQEQCSIISAAGWSDHDCIGPTRTTCSRPAP